jgi:hypothetical protein
MWTWRDGSARGKEEMGVTTVRLVRKLNTSGEPRGFLALCPGRSPFGVVCRNGLRNALLQAYWPATSGINVTAV